MILTKTFDWPSFTILNRIVPILMLAGIAFFIIFTFSLLFRRCHDIGYSGWFGFLAFLPYIGIVAMLYFLFKEGNKDANKYGNPPLEDRKFLKDIFNY